MSGRAVHCTLDALPPHLRDQAAAQLGMAQPDQPKPVDIVQTRSTRGPTKTELRYRREVLDRNPAVRSVTFEGLTFRMANGHRYTPDWVFIVGDRIHAVEVKGSYKLGSYQRARLAFDQARIEWPTIHWIWAELRDGEFHTTNSNQRKGDANV